MTKKIGELLLVEVPKNIQSYTLGVSAMYKGAKYLIFDTTTSNGHDTRVDLPTGNYSILGLITENEIGFDCEGYVDVIGGFIAGNVKFYRNYKYEVPQPVSFTFTNKDDSFRSLLSSHGISLDKNNLLVIKIEK